MTIRFAFVAAAALSCAACAKQSPLQPMGLGYYGQIDAHYAQPSAVTAKTATLKFPSARPTPKMRQTLGGKVLSAIALERVTGRKPDPRRFNELR